MKYQYVIILLFPLMTLGQNLTGNVLGLNQSGKYDPLPGASLHWLNTETGTVSDTSGKFSIPYVGNSSQIVVSYVGYADDTLTVRQDVRFMNIVKRTLMSTDSVVIKAKISGSSVSSINPQFQESLNQRELYKAACCNLGESFQSNATVDVSYQDAASGAKQIRLLGLSGIYSQIITENTPAMRGLATAYGLGYIPGPWMERIDIAKGASSVLNGYEGLTGQINVEYKKPEKSPRLYLNLYGNQMSRTEGSLLYATPVGKKKNFHTMTMLHGNIIPMMMDRNKDYFADEHLQKQMAVHHRWTYFDDKGLEFQLSVKHLEEKREAGQVMAHGDGFHIDNPYLIGIRTKRTEIMYKNGWVNIKKPYQSLGLSVMGVLHNQKSSLGNNLYKGKEENIAAKLVYQTIIDNTNHTLRTGVSYVFDNFDESYNQTQFLLKESIPGVFGEYSYKHLEKFDLVAGFRADYHNIFKMIITPRLHLRYQPFEKTIFRASAGRGTRVPHIFADNPGLLISGRTIQIDSPLMPENGWNYGVSAQQYLEILGKEARVLVDFYRTDFSNQIIADREDATLLRFYNLNGKSFSQIFQIEGMIEPVEGMEIKAAYKWNQVMAQYESGFKAVPFTPRDRGLLAFTYKTPSEKWTFDLTGNYTGKSRIPSLEKNPAATERAEVSPAFFMLFGQVTYSFPLFDIYLGGENLTNYTQKSPIINVGNPFENTFDATMVWGPVYGIMGYAGLRWTIKK